MKCNVIQNVGSWYDLGSGTKIKNDLGKTFTMSKEITFGRWALMGKLERNEPKLP